ncbi:hypothetical protein ACFQFG_14075 [Methylobacterium persicinum]
MIDCLADAFVRAGSKPAAVIPVHAGRRGNPILLNLRLLGEDIAGLQGDRGAGPCSPDAPTSWRSRAMPPPPSTSTRPRLWRSLQRRGCDRSRLTDRPIRPTPTLRAKRSNPGLRDLSG